MSRTTEVSYVRGTTVAKVETAIEARLASARFERVRNPDGRESGDLREVALRRVGKWILVADADQGDLEGWGEHLSRTLGRSVLTLFTWDGEATVVATRWKDGTERAQLELLTEAYRGKDGTPRAPAKVVWPWLAPERRAAITRDGIALVAPPLRPSGNPEVDALLAEIRAAEVLATGEDEGFVFATIEASVGGIAAVIGIADPWVRELSDEGTRVLRFREVGGRST